MKIPKKKDYEYEYDIDCPKCGHSPTHWRYCSELGCEDGFIDESEENFCIEGTIMIPCNTCHGTGIERWCPKCGHEIIEADFFDQE